MDTVSALTMMTVRSQSHGLLGPRYVAGMPSWLLGPRDVWHSGLLPHRRSALNGLCGVATGGTRHLGRGEMVLVGAGCGRQRLATPLQRPFSARGVNQSDGGLAKIADQCLVLPAVCDMEKLSRSVAGADAVRSYNSQNAHFAALAGGGERQTPKRPTFVHALRPAPPLSFLATRQPHTQQFAVAAHPGILPTPSNHAPPMPLGPSSGQQPLLPELSRSSPWATA